MSAERQETKMSCLKALLAAVLAVTLSMCACDADGTDENKLIIAETFSVTGADVSLFDQAGGTNEASSMVVYICGEVKSPGVYELEAPARLYEAVAAAGGLSSEADSSSVNLAQLIADGERIIIPKIGTVNESNSAGVVNNSGLININSADRSLLMTLPGIGEAKADAIIAYRSSNGGFSSIEDIMKVPGIKTAVFQKIKEMISISG